MKESFSQSHLLDLPAELRNRVYECLFSAAATGPIECSRTGRKCDNDILSISRVSKQLRRESLPFYWSCTPFRINHPGHRDLSSYDEQFYLWLRDVVKGNVQDIRRLQFAVQVPYIRPSKVSNGSDPSQAIINIDLNFSDQEEAVTIEGYYCNDPTLLILRYIRKAVSQIPRVERKPLVSQEVLWNIYEACYFIMRTDMTERRTWAEFTRAYELNQSTTSPRRWSAEVFFEMSQEIIHGPEWRDRLVAQKRLMSSMLKCR